MFKLKIKIAPTIRWTSLTVLLYNYSKWEKGSCTKVACGPETFYSLSRFYSVCVCVCVCVGVCVCVCVRVCELWKRKHFNLWFSLKPKQLFWKFPVLLFMFLFNKPPTFDVESFNFNTYILLITHTFGICACMIRCLRKKNENRKKNKTKKTKNKKQQQRYCIFYAVIYIYIYTKGKRKVQGVPQSQIVALRDTKRKRKPTNPNKHKSNKRT